MILTTIAADYIKFEVRTFILTSTRALHRAQKLGKKMLLEPLENSQTGAHVHRVYKFRTFWP